MSLSLFGTVLYYILGNFPKKIDDISLENLLSIFSDNDLLGRPTTPTTIEAINTQEDRERSVY